MKATRLSWFSTWALWGLLARASCRRLYTCPRRSASSSWRLLPPSSPARDLEAARCRAMPQMASALSMSKSKAALNAVYASCW